MNIDISVAIHQGGPMGESVMSPVINFKLLQEFQIIYQTNMNELIDLYLCDVERKFSQLYKALQSHKIQEFASSARELRCRSLDIGAVQYSHMCLSLEIAGQEMRLENLNNMLKLLEEQFSPIKAELLRIKKISATNFKALATEA